MAHKLRSGVHLAKGLEPAIFSLEFCAQHSEATEAQTLASRVATACADLCINSPDSSQQPGPATGRRIAADVNQANAAGQRSDGRQHLNNARGEVKLNVSVGSAAACSDVEWTQLEKVTTMASSGHFGQIVSRFFGDYLSAMSGGSAFGRLVKKAVHDAATRERLLQFPTQVLAEAGVVLPDGMEVEVLENTDRVIHLVLPPLVELQTDPREGGTS